MAVVAPEAALGLGSETVNIYTGLYLVSASTKGASLRSEAMVMGSIPPVVVFSPFLS